MATRPRRDYYAVLGIPRTADRATVRRAFRSLASELHPDVSTDPDAIERFRELAEAYEVLSRPDARARYDRFGFDARGLGDLAARDVDISRLFEDLLDLGSTASFGRKRGRDVSAVLELSDQEALEGSRRGVHYTALTVCIACSGSGRRSASPCAECSEAGRLELDRVQLVEVPPETGDGDELRIPSAGSAGVRGGEPGDLVVTVRLRPTGDTSRFRKVAAVGALCALGLLAFVVVLVVLPH